MERREMKFLATNPIHLFTDNLHDLHQDSPPKRKETVDPSRQLSNHARANEKLMTHNLSISRVLS